jgi:hypothetical protein
MQGMGDHLMTTLQENATLGGSGGSAGARQGQGQGQESGGSEHRASGQADGREQARGGCIDLNRRAADLTWSPHTHLALPIVRARLSFLLFLADVVPLTCGEGSLVIGRDGRWR